MKIGSFNFLNNQRRKTQNALQDSLRRLSSGRNNFRDNPASAAIGEGLRSQARSLNIANQGINRASATLQVAEGGLSSINNDLQRLRDLAVQASNGTLSDGDRANLQSEFDQLVDNINSTASNTSFGGESLLDGSFSQSINTGADGADNIDVDIEGSSASDLGVSGEGVSTQDAAQDAIAAIDAAIDQVNSRRANIGATQSRLESSFEANAIQAENVAAAESQLNDSDFAAEVSNLVKLQIQQEAQTQVQKIQQQIAKSQNSILGTIGNRNNNGR